jgi:7-cyano-7-deazaguanine synthase in queuosine biosynthesis
MSDQTTCITRTEGTVVLVICMLGREAHCGRCSQCQRRLAVLEHLA